jgi:hypothetical protein
MLTRFALAARRKTCGRLDHPSANGKYGYCGKHAPAVIRAPIDWARSIAPSRAFYDRSEPSVGTKMCLNMALSVIG